MGMLRVGAAGALVACTALAASIVPGDARRGGDDGGPCFGGCLGFMPLC